MANIDPNTYALSMTLQLDSALASESISRLGDSISSLEADISRAIQGSVDSIGVGITSMMSGFTDISNVATQLLTDSARLSTDLSNIRIETPPLAELTEASNILQGIVEFYTSINRNLSEETEALRKNLEYLTEYDKQIIQKNKKHEEENQFVGEEGELLQENDGLLGNISKSLKGNAALYRSIFNNAKIIWDVLSEFDKETNNFTEANYRLLGSQYELVTAVNMLSAETGLSRQLVTETYKGLADVKYPKEQIGSLTIDIGMFNKVTGTSASTTVAYANAMRQAGHDANITSVSLLRMAHAQRNLGLSAADSNRIMEQQTADAATQIAFFGAEVVSQFELIRIGLAAIGKETGMAGKEQEELMKMMQLTGADAMKIWSTLGGLNFEEMADPTKRFDALGKVVKNFAGTMGMTTEQLAKGSQGNAYLQAQLESQAKAYGTTAEAMVAAAKAQLDLTAKNKQGLLTTEGLNEALKSQMDMAALYAEATKTMTQEYEKLYDKISAMITPAMLIFTEVLGEVLIYINYMADGIINLGQEIGKFFAELVKNYPWIGDLGQYLKKGAAAAVLLTLAFGGLTWIMGLVGSAFTVLGRGITTVATIAGESLSNFGRAVAPVAPTLLKIGVAMLALGAGAALLATSIFILFDVFKQYNDMAAGTYVHLWAFIGIFALVAATIVGLGALANFVVPGLLALGGAFLMIGIGTYLVAAGFALVASSAMQMAVAFVFLMDAFKSLDIYEMGYKMVAGAVMIGAGALALGVAGGALLFAAIPFGAGILAMSIATGGLDILAARIYNAGSAIYNGGIFFKAGIAILKSAFVDLAELRTLVKEARAGISEVVKSMDDLSLQKILLFSNAISLAGPGLFTGAFLFNSAMQLLEAGANSMLKLLDVFTVVGVQLAVSTEKIMISAVSITQSAFMMMQGGFALRIGVLSLLGAVGLLIPLALGLSMAGSSLMFGSTILSIATSYLLLSTGRMARAAQDMNLITAAIDSVSNSLLQFANVAIITTTAVADNVVKLTQSVSLIGQLFEKFNSIKSAIDTGMTIIPGLQSFADGLKIAAEQVGISVQVLMAPLQSLNTLLADSISTVEQYGYATIEQLSLVNVELERYAVSIQSAIDKINSLAMVRSSILTEMADTQNTIAAESISTVRVLNAAEGGETDPNTDLMRQGITMLGMVVELLEKVAEGETDFSGLAQLLKQSGPKQHSVLAADFNNWG